MDEQRLEALDLDDWSLIAVALAQWAGNPNQLETSAERRAYYLIETIAAANDCTPTELVERYRAPVPGPRDDTE